MNKIKTLIFSIIIVLSAAGIVMAFTGPGSNPPPSGSPVSSLIPSGFVGFFNLASCPTGWTALAAAQGRYLVGGNSTGTVGTALSSLENRAVGQHAHTATQVSHQHNFGNIPDLSGGGPGMSGEMDAEWGGNKFTDSQTPAITVNNAGSVAGTNAPYLQLLVCQKN